MSQSRVNTGTNPFTPTRELSAKLRLQHTRDPASCLNSLQNAVGPHAFSPTKQWHRQMAVTLQVKQGGNNSLRRQMAVILLVKQEEITVRSRRQMVVELPEELGVRIPTMGAQTEVSARYVASRGF